MQSDYIKLIGMHNTIVLMQKKLWRMKLQNIQPSYDALSEALRQIDTLKEANKNL